MAALYKLVPGTFPRISAASDGGGSWRWLLSGVGVAIQLCQSVAEALALIWFAVAVGFLSLITFALLAG